MAKVLDWVKAHPYSSAAIVIGGGITFFVLSGWGSGGGSTSSGSVSQGKSDAEIMAEAQIQAAQIQSQAQNAGFGYQLEAAKIQAAYAAQESEYNFLLGKEQILASKEMYAIGAQTSIVNNYLQSATTLGVIALSNPITTTSSSKKGGGLFGLLGGGSKTSTTTTQTPQVVPLPDLGSIIGQIQLPGQSQGTNTNSGNASTPSTPAVSTSVSTGQLQIASQF